MRIAVACLGCVFAAVAWAEVDLEWRAPDTVPVGATVELGLYAVGEDEPFCAAEAVLAWPADGLELVGSIENTEPDYLWMMSGLPGEPSDWGLNETWEDGDAYWFGLAVLGGDPPIATVEGTLLTTFVFTAWDDATVTLLPESGYALTAVWSAEQVATNIVGELGSATVTVDYSLAIFAPDAPDVEAENDGASDLHDWRR